MSIIPQRPPDTPLMSFYSTGKYDKKFSQSLPKKHPAIPGFAATINERNKRAYEEIDVKPITQKPVDQKYFVPQKYLKPFEEGYAEGHKNVSTNSIAYNRIINKKKAAEEYKQPTKDRYVTNGLQTDKNEFLNRKNSLGDLRMTSHGKFICEKVLYASKDEQEYFKNSKIFTKDDQSSPYKKQIPDYFRILEDPRNQKKITDSSNNDGMITIVSKNQGWITVTPKHQNRKKPIEKANIGDVTKTSILTPSWMQIQFPKNNTDTMKATVEKFGLRRETNRTFLCDKDQPKKSVFNYQHIRHNVHSKELAELYSNQANLSNEPQRLIEWQENPGKQKYDKPITTKIGSSYDK